MRQELANLALAGLLPKLPVAVSTPLGGLPDPALIRGALEGSRFEAAVIEAAAEIMDGRYRLLGLDLVLGKNLNWREDPVHHRETPANYFRRIPYLSISERAGRLAKSSGS